MKTKHVARKISTMTDLELAIFCGYESAEDGSKVRAKCLQAGWDSSSAIPAGFVIE